MPNLIAKNVAVPKIFFGALLLLLWTEIAVIKIKWSFANSPNSIFVCVEGGSLELAEVLFFPAHSCALHSCFHDLIFLAGSPLY